MMPSLTFMLPQLLPLSSVPSFATATYDVTLAALAICDALIFLTCDRTNVADGIAIPVATITAMHPLSTGPATVEEMLQTLA
jgi:hypothetical protein